MRETSSRELRGPGGTLGDQELSCIVHAFPDEAGISAHFEGSDERSRSAYELITPAGFELYGSVPRALIEQMRRDAADAGVGLDLLLDPIGGFLRSQT